MVRLEWPSVSNAISYNIYWSLSPPATKFDTKITDVTSPYTHAALTNGTTYYYVITAVNDSGESTESAVVSATPLVDNNFQKTYGGADDEHAESVQQTSDGGYILVGSAYSDTGKYIYLIKTDSKGNELWSKTFGGINNQDAEAYSGQQTTDGGYVLAGKTGSSAKDYDVYLIKTDSDGNEVWSKTFGGTGTQTSSSVQETSDGGFVIAGYTDSSEGNIYLIKTDSNGSEVWSKTYVGVANSVQQTTDGGYIVAGWGYDSNSTYGGAFILETDSNGNELWSKVFVGNGYAYAESVQETSDGGYVIAGYTSTLYVLGDMAYLIKTDSNGNEVWSKVFDPTYNRINPFLYVEYTRAYSVQQTTDGGYIVAGETTSSGAGGYDVYLEKTDSNGNRLWAKTFGGTSTDTAYSVQQTADGGYVLAGYTYSGTDYNVFLIKTDSDGTLSQ